MGDQPDAGGQGLGSLHFSRRRFLVLTGGAALLTACDPSSVPVDVPMPGSSTGDVFSAGFPRTLAFRRSEGLVRRSAYPDWERSFLPFGGIVGKVLQEERSDTTGAKNIEYFSRFKQRNPDKLVLLHFNGHGRVPGYETEGWWPGYWLYAEGTTLRSSVDDRSTTLEVGDASAFSLRRGGSGGRSADVVVAAMGADGRPDFRRAEQLIVTGVDEQSGTLSVQRGRYGTAARSASAGAYVAVHVVTGPWCADCDRVWVYNFSTRAPRDPAGRSVAEAIVEGLATKFAADGELADFDGLQLDTATLRPIEAERTDADCDGAVDGAVFDGVDTYTAGFADFTSRLRAALGPERLILTDGSIGQRLDTSSVNGIEEEGFPALADYDMIGWSQGLMALVYWRSRGAPRRLSYPLFKFTPPHHGPGLFRRFRLVLAAALFTDSAFSFAEEPTGGDTVDTEPDASGKDRVTDVSFWDELFAGVRGTPNWLGQPTAPAVHLATRGTDVLGGSQVAVRVGAASAPDLEIDSIPVVGEDLVIAVELMGQREQGQAPGVGRLVTVTATGEEQGVTVTHLLTVDDAWLPTVLYFRGIGAGAASVTFSATGAGALRRRNLRAFAAVDAVYRTFEHGAVFANPSLSPYTFQLDELIPDIAYTRISGTRGQDTTTNDGAELGRTLTLGALDALIVRTR